MKSLSVSFIFILFYFIGFSQEQQQQNNDTIQRIATLEYKDNGDYIQFIPKAPKLNQIAGAPKAFYSNYWEFGDGTYSKELAPKHTYKKAGEYKVKLWATNNYDTGKPPTSRPQKIKINNDANTYQDQASMSSNFEIQRNREPIPEEEIVVIVSYKNTKNYVTDGKLYLFYNETKYDTDNFEITDVRTHHGEVKENENTIVYTHQKLDNETYYASAENDFLEYTIQPQDTTKKENLELTLKEAKVKYKKSNKWSFKNMKPGEERNIFYTLKTTPEMLKDTSAIISVRGIYIPDENYDTHNVKDMEMEIVTSHDPNKMSTNATFLNYRLVRYKRPKFKIKFQNNGEGPARTIRLETDIPEMFDKSSIKIEDMYPKCKICPKYEVNYSCLDTTFTDKQAIFTFKNIYLPGSEQKNVKVYDSTKGFLKYSLKFNNGFHKKKTKSRTAIIFDKNEPIITNYSTTRFLPGISIGIKMGYNSFSNLENSKSYFFGATVSPYKSYRLYWQIELLNNFHKYDGASTFTEGMQDTPNGVVFQQTSTLNSYKNIDWEVPIIARYNVNNYLGLGAGLQSTISLSEKHSKYTKIERFEGQNAGGPLLETLESSDETKNTFSNLKTGFLVEATLGFARIGPSIGARYVFNFKKNFNYMQFYAIWKF